MSNNWGYSSLGQRDRLDLIRKGNTDVYNYEKNKNAGYRKSLVDAGLSTTDVDNWDATIDNAFGKATSKVDRSGLPKFSSAGKNSELTAALISLKRKRDADIEETNKNAESARKYLEEWLVNNGYSDDGKLATESKKELEDSVAKKLKNIKTDYKLQLRSLTNKFDAMLK